MTDIQKIWIGIAVGILLFFALNFCGAALFSSGLRRYYSLEPAKVLCIGHSMSEMGIDRNLLAKRLNMPVAKYCINGADIQDRMTMICHYLETVKNPPEVIVYDVSGRSFSFGLAKNSYQLFFPFIEESQVCDSYVRSSASSREYWCKKLIPLSRYDDTRLGAVIRGWRGNWENMSLKKFDPEQFQRDIKSGHFWKITLNQDSLRTFRETVKLLKKKRIRMVLAALPCVDMLNNAEPEKYERIMSIFKDIARDEDHVYFLDLNPEFSRRYELFGDPIHLSPAGQRKITERLASYLNSLFEKNWRGEKIQQ